MFTNDKGGIKDDLIVTKTDKDFIYMVTNAGCIDKDLPYLQVFFPSKILNLIFGSRKMQLNGDLMAKTSKSKHSMDVV